MRTIFSTKWLVMAVAAGVWIGCGSTSGPGIAQGPSDTAVAARIPALPDSVIEKVWESVRSDGVMARKFNRMAGDTTNIAFMESDWVYVPDVYPSAGFGSLSENQKWVKFLFWAVPDRGGTLLYMDVLFDPTALPTEPVMWSRMVSVPQSHPSWGYVQALTNDIGRRLDIGESG